MWQLVRREERCLEVMPGRYSRPGMFLGTGRVQGCSNGAFTPGLHDFQNFTAEISFKWVKLYRRAETSIGVQYLAGNV